MADHRYPWWNTEWPLSRRVEIAREIKATNPTYVQYIYRGRQDDGDMEPTDASCGAATGSTPYANCDTSFTAPNSSTDTWRCIIGLVNDNAANGSSEEWQLEARYDGGGGFGSWFDVTTSSNTVKAVTTPQETNDTSTANWPVATGCSTCGVIDIASTNTGDGGSDGAIFSADGRIANGIAKGDSFGLEYALQLVPDDVSSDASIELRVYDAINSRTVTYLSTPSIKVGKGAPQTFTRELGDDFTFAEDLQTADELGRELTDSFTFADDLQYSTVDADAGEEVSKQLTDSFSFAENLQTADEFTREMADGTALSETLTWLRRRDEIRIVRIFRPS